MALIVIILFTIIGFLGAVISGVAIRIMFPDLPYDKFRKGSLFGAIGVCLAIGLLPALGCAGASLITGRTLNINEVLGLALPGIIVFVEIVVVTPISYKLAGRISNLPKL